MTNKTNRNLGEVSANTITATAINTGTTTLTAGTNIVLPATSNLTYSPARTVSVAYQVEANGSVINTLVPTVAGWRWNSDLNIMFGMQGTGTGAYFYQIIPNPRNGAVLASVDLYYLIAGSARSPATNRLQLTVRRQDLTAFTAAALMAYTSVPAYSTFNSIITTNFVMTGNNTIDTSQYVYYLGFKEEAGSGAVAGNGVYTFKLNYTISNQTI